MFNLAPTYSARKSSNHKLSINHKIDHDTNLHKQNIHKHRTQNFRRISPFGITPVEKAHKALVGHAGIVNHSVDLYKNMLIIALEYTPVTYILCIIFLMYVAAIQHLII